MLNTRTKIEKLYYSIGEVAGLFEVNPSLIRYWEKEFSVLKPRKNKKGSRQYTREDLDTLRLIYHLVKERGYTLQGAKEALQSERREITEKMQAIETLQRVKAFLLELKHN